MFRHLGAVCLEIQYEINHTNLLLDNIASASFFIEFDTEKSADIKSKHTIWHNIIFSKCKRFKRLEVVLIIFRLIDKLQHINYLQINQIYSAI